MNPLGNKSSSLESYLNTIPGIKVESAADSPNELSTASKKYKVTVKDSYNYTKETEVYKQSIKNISFKERYTLGRLIGFGLIRSFFSAIFTILDDQTQVTQYYIEKLKNIKKEDFQAQSFKFYNNKNITRDILEDKLSYAFFQIHANPDAKGSDDSPLAFFNKAKEQLVSVDFVSSNKEITITKDRNKLQTIGSIPIRAQKYHFLSSAGLKMKENILSEELLSIPDEPIFKAVQKTQAKFLSILGFNVKPSEGTGQSEEFFLSA
jgi:hypothetical protein